MYKLSLPSGVILPWPRVCIGTAINAGTCHIAILAIQTGFPAGIQITWNLGAVDRRRKIRPIKILKILSDASAVIAEGEVLQLLTTNDTETSEEAYLEVIRSKTATLFAAAAHIGAVVAERPKAEEEALESYGMNLGIAFQLVDDALDYSADPAALGKTVGDDFREGKINLPVILAWRRGDYNEREFWRRTLERQEQKDGDLEYAIALMEQHGALVDTIERAQHYGAIARDALGIFPDNDAKSAMCEAIDFSIERAF